MCPLFICGGFGLWIRPLNLDVFQWSRQRLKGPGKDLKANVPPFIKRVHTRIHTYTLHAYIHTHTHTHTHVYICIQIFHSFEFSLSLSLYSVVCCRITIAIATMRIRKRRFGAASSSSSSSELLLLNPHASYHCHSSSVHNYGPPPPPPAAHSRGDHDDGNGLRPPDSDGDPVQYIVSHVATPDREENKGEEDAGHDDGDRHDDDAGHAFPGPGQGRYSNGQDSGSYSLRHRPHGADISRNRARIFKLSRDDPHSSLPLKYATTSPPIQVHDKCIRTYVATYLYDIHIYTVHTYIHTHTYIYIYRFMKTEICCMDS